MQVTCTYRTMRVGVGRSITAWSPKLDTQNNAPSCRFERHLLEKWRAPPKLGAWGNVTQLLLEYGSITICTLGVTSCTDQDVTFPVEDVLEVQAAVPKTRQPPHKRLTEGA